MLHSSAGSSLYVIRVYEINGKILKGQKGRETGKIKGKKNPTILQDSSQMSPSRSVQNHGLITF